MNKSEKTYIEKQYKDNLIGLLYGTGTYNVQYVNNIEFIQKMDEDLNLNLNYAIIEKDIFKLNYKWDFLVKNGILYNDKISILQGMEHISDIITEKWYYKMNEDERDRVCKNLLDMLTTIFENQDIKKVLQVLKNSY